RARRVSRPDRHRAGERLLHVSSRKRCRRGAAAAVWRADARGSAQPRRRVEGVRPAGPGAVSRGGPAYGDVHRADAGGDISRRIVSGVAHGSARRQHVAGMDGGGVARETGVTTKGGIAMADTRFVMSRRALLQTSFWGGALAAIGVATPGRADAASESGTASIVETNAGKVRSVVNRGVLEYRGVPYGASTAAPNRFLPPKPATPWTGVFDAFQNGHSSPQIPPAPSAIGSGLRGTALQGEDCLVLNVFTPGLGDGRRRPVMMWIHGGGYTYGSGSSLGYDGANLARSGDVVVVCINHRLNIVGHLYLGAVGDGYADSGNVGLLDIVAALQWVRDNIARFGGDAGNVTIFGQSGGGGKVSTLLAMPAAKGLFHK